MASGKIHVALNVGDLGKSIEFYRGMFGIEPTKVREGYAKFDIADPPLNLALNQQVHQEAPPDHSGALSHLGIQVVSTDEVLLARDRWKAAGLAPRDEMQTDCCYAFQDKAWIRDPDGNEWEVFVVLGDTSVSKHVCCPADTSKETADQPPAGTESGTTGAADRNLPVLGELCCSR